MHRDVYRLLSTFPAKKNAKKLVKILVPMGLEIKLSRAQEITARLMGYDSWMELHRVTAEAPEQGVPDQMLSTNLRNLRRKRQKAVLVAELGIEEWCTEGLLRALALTGEGFGQDWPTVERLDLRLNEEDLLWYEASMKLVRQFDAAARPLYNLVPPCHDSVSSFTHVWVERGWPGNRQQRNRNTTPTDIVAAVKAAFGSDAPLGGSLLAEVEERAKDAFDALTALAWRVRELGAAPMLVPIRNIFLMLHRMHVSGDRSHYGPVCPEPILHIGFDFERFCFSPENEWNASRGLSLQLALRREFLDAGWSGTGAEWRVTIRDGNSSKEEVTIPAESPETAYAWAVAARAALRLAKGQKLSVISLISLVGPYGMVTDLDDTKLMDEPIVRRAKLFSADRLRLRVHRKAA